MSCLLRTRVVGLVLAVAAGCSGRTRAHDLAARGAQVDGLFSKLAPPRFVERTAPRLPLRSGPVVPQAHEDLSLGSPNPIAAPVPPRRASPLRVLSYAPTGHEDLVGAVRVTFDQPMVPLAEIAKLDAQTVPVRIRPQPPGRFRWLGTTTLVFEPRDRMPKATHYTVSIPEGTASAAGGRLESGVSFSFDTPPPRVVDSIPSDGRTGVGTDTLIAIQFDQRVDPLAIARAVRLEGGRGVRLMSLLGEELLRAKREAPELQ